MNWQNVLVLALCSGLNQVAMAAEPASAETPESAAATRKVADEAPRKPAPPARVAADRLDLDASVVTGNRELPKVLYIVPWKKAELGDLPEQPFNSLLDEALTPIDRDEFRREVTYYSKLAAQPAPATAVPEAAAVPSAAP